MRENANILGFFQHQESGCYLYRTKHPMEVLHANGVDVRKMEINTDIDYYDKLKSVQVYGIYPFSMFPILEKMHVDGIKIVYDFDDAMELIEPSSPFYQIVQRDVKSFREIVKLVDHITVNSLEMWKYARSRTDKPITVIPNGYDPKEWIFPKTKRPGIRIGFAGAAPHITSLIKVLPAIRNLQKKYDIRFLIMGFAREAFQEWIKVYKSNTKEEGWKAVDTFVESLEDIKFEWVPFTEYYNYPATLRNLGLDIGLCPLEPTPFNLCRSASKPMEYTLGGALALASDLPPYQADQSSILVKDDQWEEAIEHYITHPEQRQQKLDQHTEWLKDNRQMKHLLPKLREIYEV